MALYNLTCEQKDRINFEELQRRAAWEGLSGLDHAYVKDLQNVKEIRTLVAEYWAAAKEEIAVQVDDIEEAKAIFLSVWEKVWMGVF